MFLHRLVGFIGKAGVRRANEHQVMGRLCRQTREGPHQTGQVLVRPAGAYGQDERAEQVVATA